MTLPTKHQLLLQFQGGALLSVSIQLYGAIYLMREDVTHTHPALCPNGMSPLSDAFTLDYLLQLFKRIAPDDPTGIIPFITVNPAIRGVGHGYAPDILFRAHIHPRRKAVDLHSAEQRALYKAMRDTLAQAVDQGGRDTERDLYYLPGGYRCIMDRAATNHPCRKCQYPVRRITVSGFPVCVCPHCQT